MARILTDGDDDLPAARVILPMFDTIIYALKGDDYVGGDQSNETIYGGEGNDILCGIGYTGLPADPNYFLHFGEFVTGSGDDTLDGGAGSDILYGGDGNDTLYGGDGDDGGVVSFRTDHFYAGLFGGDGNDKLYGDGGNDKLYGENGDDILQGGTGNDLLEGGAGHDVLRGGTGLDAASYFFSAGVTLNLSNHALDRGNAALDQFFSIENIVGSEKARDVLTGDAASNSLYGYGGNDVLAGMAGADVLVGGDGNDSLYGNDGSDALHGDKGNDALLGGNGDDVLYGDAGGDTLNGGSGEDAASYYLDAAVTANLANASANKGAAQFDTYVSIENLVGSNTGNDSLTGNGLANSLYGGGGNDTLSGLGGNDTLVGDAGSDRLFGNFGSDTLVGGTGSDTLTGGAGTDAYYYRAANEGGDSIALFELGEKFIIQANGFGIGYKGLLTTNLFHSSAAGVAHDADDRFIFKTTGDILYYDPDGTGSRPQVMIADLGNHFTLNSYDILIV